jgi:hypothetical protein
MSLAIILLLAALDAVTFGPGNRFHLERSKDDFGVRSHGVVETLGANRTRFYPLPQSAAEEYIRLRPEDQRTNPIAPDQYEREEVIGPYQIEGGRIWFGKSYYEGEGMRGVGAFGYFDTATRGYTVFSPRDVARYEISAILVQPDRVWIALDQFGEDISTSPGGLARWNRMTHEIHRYPLEFGVSRIRVEGDSLRLTTRGGYALFRDGEVRRFLTNGRPIARFPPLPTHY